jgi:hypothetical protein
VITTTFTSCKKDNTSPSTSQTDQDYNNYFLDGDAAKIRIAKLQAEFKDTSTKSRDGSSNIPLAEAIWNIEAVANATYGHTNFKRKILKVFRDSVIIATSMENGIKVVSSLVQSQKYTQVADSILSKGNSFNWPSNKRSMIFTDINAVSDASGTQKMEIVIGIGLDTAICPNCPPLVDALVYTPTCTVTDNWYWGLGNGKCNPGVPRKYTNTDATDVIEGLINGAAYGGIPCIGYFDYINVSNNTDDYFTLNIKSSPFYGPYQFRNNNYNANTQPDYYQYLLFRSTDSGACLNPTDINYFRSNLDYIIHNDKASNSSPPLWTNGKLFLNCDLKSTFIPGSVYEHCFQYNTANFIKR